MSVVVVVVTACSALNLCLRGADATKIEIEMSFAF